MSILTDRTVKCPGCGKPAVHRVARSLNAGRSPELVQEILHDRFQRFTCPTCGYAYLVEDPFIFIDFTTKLWIGHFPRSWETHWKKLERQPLESYQRAMGGDAPAVARRLGEGFTVRAVFGLAALRDKLQALRAGLDDRRLEALKLEVMRQAHATLSRDARPTLLLVEKEHLVLHLPQPEPGEVLHVPRAHLSQMPLLPELSEGPYVDVGRLLPHHHSDH